MGFKCVGKAPITDDPDLISRVLLYECLSVEVPEKRVWKALLEIPYGETRSYQDIAVAVGNGKATRAVGMANHRNPIAIIIPCHRVIGKAGKLVGYGGGIERKQYLLEMEAATR